VGGRLGRILPRWEASPPNRVTGNRLLLGRLAVMDCDEGRLLTFPLADWPQVWGANLAFCRELFDRVGTFDTAKGVKGTKLARGEEVDLISRALEQGARVAHDSSITVLREEQAGSSRALSSRRAGRGCSTDAGASEAGRTRGSRTSSQHEHPVRPAPRVRSGRTLPATRHPPAPSR